MAAMTSVADAFRNAAREFADVAALTSPRAQYTYRDLDRWSDAVAAMLVSRDAPLDRPIAFVMRDAIALVPALLGALKAGHYFVILDASEPAERLDAIRAASNASITIADADVVPLANASVEPIAREPHEIVQLIFTSGTTGKPKAVAHKQRGLVERMVAQARVTGREAGQRVSYTALPGFARATYEILGSLMNGATLCAYDARTETLDDLAAFITRERVSILTLTPALFRRFMRVIPADLDLSTIRKLRIGADVMTIADVEAFKARFPRTCTLERGFNATETGMVTHISITHDTPVPGPLVPIGRPRPNVALRLVGEDGHEVADNEPGELIVTSPHVVEGYWNDPELTAQKFTFDSTSGHRTFHTGDLVKRDADGLHYFVGRKDSRLKIHGRRIDPLEVESALLQYANVREAVAVGKQDADGESHLVAYVVMRDNAPCVPRDIRAALRDNIPAYLIPSRIHAIDAIPMTRAGKVDRHALRDRVETIVIDDTHHDGDEIERTLLDIWSRVLNAAVAPDDDFFNDHGGESIVAAYLVAEVKRLLGRNLALSALLELNTVTKMADYLRTRTDRDRLAVTVQQGTSAHPLFLVSGKGGSVIAYRKLAASLGAEQTVIGLTHDGFLPETFPKTFPAMAACYVDAIRAIQPEGPYFIAGYSAGGMVTLDVARQLSLAGQHVAFAGMIDTALDTTLGPKWKRLAKHLDLLVHHPRTHTPRYLGAIGRRLMGMTRWLRGKGFSLYAEPPVVPPLQVLYSAVRKRDALQPYSGRVTLFIARHGWGTDALHRDLGWNRYCANLDVVEVDGEHMTVLHEDVASLAHAMRDAISRAT
ncbi:MAG TPA: AMP-binding protein [Thermoanaerobaculia bacterium]